jgi:hypothetical protein
MLELTIYCGAWKESLWCSGVLFLGEVTSGSAQLGFSCLAGHHPFEGLALVNPGVLLISTTGVWSVSTVVLCNSQESCEYKWRLKITSPAGDLGLVFRAPADDTRMVYSSRMLAGVVTECPVVRAVVCAV